MKETSLSFRETSGALKVEAKHIWLIKACFCPTLEKQTTYSIFAWSLFVNSWDGVRLDRTLWFKCATPSLLSPLAEGIWNETRHSQPVLYWIHQSHGSQCELCLPSKTWRLHVVALFFYLSDLQVFLTKSFWPNLRCNNKCMENKES